MKFRTRVGATAVALTALALASGGVASAAEAQPGPRAAHRSVFVQTDNTAGNQVVVYDRAGDGTLTPAGRFDTGGLGGTLNGSVVDHLASQGSLTYDGRQGLLYAVNAGSNTVSVFSVAGDRLFLRQVVSSGGVFPVSVTVHDGLVYVLNALGGGSVEGFFSLFGHLYAIPGSHRSLGLTIPSDGNQFTNTPGQVAFSPDGTQLIVTTKLNLSAIDVFRVGLFGNLSAAPVVNAEPGTGPFGVTFDPAGHLVVANTESNSLATYVLNPNGTVTPVSAVATGQAATCWVTPGLGFFYASNAGSASVSGFRESPAGSLTLLVPPTSTDPGTVDGAAVGRFLYVRTGLNGNVDEFRINPNGSLTGIGSVTVPSAVGGEGIAVS